MTSIVTSDAEAPRVAPYPVKRFSVEEYHRLGEIGILTEDDNVELLEGWIVPKMIHNPRHDGTIGLLDRNVRSALPREWIIRIQSAITTADSEPEPDLVVARGPEENYLQKHPRPADIAMLAEVADTFLARDREKSALYGRAGVVIYWIVNLIDRRVEVYTDPTGLDVNPGYRRRDDYGPDDELSLLIDSREVARLSVGALLP